MQKYLSRRWWPKANQKDALLRGAVVVGMLVLGAP